MSKQGNMWSKSLNSTATVLGLLVAVLVMIWISFVCSTTFSKTSVMEDINHQLSSLTINSAEQEKRLEMHKLSHVSPKRVLLVGLIDSPRELYEDQSVLESIFKLCYAYHTMQDAIHAGAREGFVELQVLYRQEERIGARSVISLLNEKLQEAGCRANFNREEDIMQPADVHIEQGGSSALSRYRKLARLRSTQRQHILSRHSAGDFDAVINVDLDIVQFPPLHALLEAVERAAQAAKTDEGSIVCANGHETWTVGSSWIQRRLYYDTFAAIDIHGDYYYTKYAASIWQIITFGQTNLFRDILQQHPALWPMQTCFGGLAIYDFLSWSNMDCDYDQGNIKLRAASLSQSKQGGTRGRPVFEQQLSQFQEHIAAWKVPPQYTIDSTPDGDVCEHVVFQQCLLASAQARNKPVPRVGIQPNLLIGREAAILSQSEDKINFVKKILFVFLLLNGMSLLVNHLRERIENVFRYSRAHPKKGRPAKRRSSDTHWHKA